MADFHDVNGAPIASVSAGDGGVPLMALHGFTGWKEDFGEEIGPLADAGFWVVAPDLRGHGESHHPTDESDYSLEIFASDAFGLADALGWDAFHLMGHSMGGMVAQVMVLDRPSRVSSLVLMDTHHGVLPDLDPNLIALGQELARTEGLEVIQNILKMGQDPLANPAYERLCAERPGYREWAEAKMLSSSPAMYASMLGQLAEVPDRLDRLAAVEVPTLAIVGELDASFVAATEAMARIIPGARHVVVPGGGHSPQFEAQEAWRTAVRGFFDEVVGLSDAAAVTSP